MNDHTVIQVEHLTKRYGSVVAADGVSFAVRQGEVFGMVGPNGAGKTTTIECIEGLRQPDAGAIRVLGLDPQSRTDERELRERIGVQLQSASLPNRLRVGEALDLFASFYRNRADPRPLVEALGLTEKRKSYVGQLSGGQRQRLFVALALLNTPQVVFLDELTTGLDPQARRATWELVRSIRDRGTTIFLTTHLMDEAERLCDRVAIMDRGRIIALDTPPNLVRQLGDELRVTFEPADELVDLRFLGVLDGVRQVGREDGRVTVSGGGQRFVGTVVVALEAAHVPFRNLRTEGPNLEDVFLSLTGRQMRD